MKKIFILLVVLFIIPSCSWIASAIDDSIQKKEEEKRVKLEQQQKAEEEKNKELAKQNRIQELLSLYDKGLTKNISEKDMDDFDLYIKDIEKIDTQKAVNINIFMCEKLNHFNACFREMVYYAKKKEEKKAKELYDKLYDWCTINGYDTACLHINKTMKIDIVNSGKYTLYDGALFKSYIVFDKNIGRVDFELVDITHKVSMPFIMENKWYFGSAPCLTNFELALQENSKIEKYYTQKCVVYPSLDGQGMFYNQGFDYQGAIKANKDYVYVEVPDYYIYTDVGALSYKGYTLKIPKKIAKEIVTNLYTILEQGIKLKPIKLTQE